MDIYGKDDNRNRRFLPRVLPLLPVRDVVTFPCMILPLAVGREKSIKALEEAMAKDRFIFLVAQKKIHVENPQLNDVYLHHI